MVWEAILAGSLGCYLLKLAGLSVPGRAMRSPRVQHIAALLPIALLATLIATQTLSTGHHLRIDARLAGLAGAATAQLLKAPFLAVVAAAAVTAALVRLVA
ncbi:MAG: AzlD domain-containing protein [Actinomycetota bacterium]|nr:AzlD domain-containing protein [Actinomycetota bacterium]